MVGEPLLVHGIAKGAELERRTAELLGVVGLDRSHAHRYPHEFPAGNASESALRGRSHSIPS